jgi:hypothetical protein
MYLFVYYPNQFVNMSIKLWIRSLTLHFYLIPILPSFLAQRPPPIFAGNLAAVPLGTHAQDHPATL